MITLSIRRPVAIAMAYLCIALLGIAAWRNLPIELLPDTDLPRLQVTASLSGASPEVTEAFLTAPIEAEIQQIRGIETLTSESYEQGGAGQTTITAMFALGTDMDFARLDLSERMAALEEKLPANASRPQVIDYVPRELREQTRPFLEYTVTGPFTLEALRLYVDEELTPELLRIDGVGLVRASGGRFRMLEVELSDTRIEALGLSPSAVESAVRGLEIIRSAGRVRSGGSLYTLSLRERAEDVAEIRRIPLLTAGGRLVRLLDVAVVRDTYEEPRSYYRIDGQPAVSFEVTREIGSNAVAVADGVKARLAQMDVQHPPGVRLILDDDTSEDIRAQLSDLRSRAMIAAVVIFIVLLLFLRSWSSAGIVFASIAFSILITLNGIYWAGYSLNVLTLMGLAMGFGLIVDNAIVVLENVYRHGGTGESPPVAAERGAREVVLPVLAATFTTIVVLIPFVYLQGELRAYYVPLAMVVGISLIASLFVAFSFIPALGSKILIGTGRPAVGIPSAGSPDAPPAGAAGSPSAGATLRPSLLHRFYSGLTGWTLRFPWVTVVVALLMLGGSYYLFDKYVTRGVVWGRFGGGDDTYILVDIELPRGEELARTEELARYFEARLKAMPEVERFVTNVSPQRATIRATFPDSIATSWIPVAIKEQMFAYSLGFGGVNVMVRGYGPSFYGGGSSPPNYRIQVLGYNYEKVREIAEDLSQRLRRFSRIQDVDPNASGTYTRDKASELVLRLDRERLAMHGLAPVEVVGRVAAAVRSASDRRSIMRLGGEEVRFAVKLEGHDRLDMLALQELLIPSPGGQSVRLGDVATLNERDVQPRILREDQQYERTVAYEFRGPVKLGDVVRDAVIAATELPPGYTIRERAAWGWSVEEKKQIYGVLIVSLLLVFMVTAALFESVRQPLVVLFSVPMALIGVFLMFFYAGASFTREAYIGVIMMGGVVVNNSILLVDHINAVRRAGRETLEAAVLRGTLERVRPILMTTATTVFGLLPLVLFSDSADQNIWNALAYALIGGLSSSTLLVLTVTPSLYLLFERGAVRRAERAAQRAAGLHTGAPAPTPGGATA
jgi:HAE1 family hydrophobic/amphiphilic exporter-1